MPLFSALERVFLVRGYDHCYGMYGFWRTNVFKYLGLLGDQSPLSKIWDFIQRANMLRESDLGCA